MNKKKIYEKVYRIACKGTNFIESGIIKNPNKARDIIYLMINGTTTKECLEMRVDEAFFIIQCLSASLNRKITNS